MCKYERSHTSESIEIFINGRPRNNCPTFASARRLSQFGRIRHNALIATSQFGHKGVAKILTEEGGTIVNDGQSLDCRALHAALSNREGEMADFLLEEGASLGGYDLNNNPSTDQL